MFDVCVYTCLFCFMFLYGLVLWIDFKKDIYICMYVYVYMGRVFIEFDHPETTLCS